MGLSRLLSTALAAYFAIIPQSYPDDPPFGPCGESPTLATFLEDVTPAVVNISATDGSGWAGMVDDELRQYLFEAPVRGALPLRSTGSGVIIDAGKGLIMTNSHLVRGAGRIVVTLKDRRAFDAVVVGTDPGIDIAVLKIGAHDLAELPLGNSDRLRVGDYIVAVGNPFGLGQTVSTGIVSALGLTELGIEDYEDFIQTDAPINPGDSGGALVNMRGELVGINTAIVSIAGANVGIGFAIPINLARISVDRLLKFGEVRRGWLGLRLQDLTPGLAAVMGVSAPQGAVVNQVLPGGPAMKAGIRAGDVIISISGKSARDAGHVRNEIGMASLGEIVRMTVVRDGHPIGFSMRVQEPPARLEVPGTEGKGLLADARFDASLGDLKGVKVVGLGAQAPLARTGLQVGDVIVAVNRQPVPTVGALFAAITGTGPFALRVWRDDAELFVVLW